MEAVNLKNPIKVAVMCYYNATLPQRRSGQLTNSEAMKQSYSVARQNDPLKRLYSYQSLKVNTLFRVTFLKRDGSITTRVIALARARRYNNNGHQQGNYDYKGTGRHVPESNQLFVNAEQDDRGCWYIPQSPKMGSFVKANLISIDIISQTDKGLN